jgi:hypothetical protein
VVLICDAKIWYCFQLVIPLEKAHEGRRKESDTYDDEVVSVAEAQGLKKRIHDACGGAGQENSGE